MTDFDDSRKSAPPSLLRSDVRVFVQLMAPRGMAAADYGVWPRIWAKYPDDGSWRVVPLQRRGRARQLAALLATREHGVRAIDAERLLAGSGPRTQGVSRHARDTLHETLAQEGLAALFPLNDRGGPDQGAWELLHATTDVAVAGAAVAAGDWSLASRLTDHGEGFLVTFPQHGQTDHARRRLPLGGRATEDIDAAVVGFALPTDLVADARQAAERVRRHLATMSDADDEGAARASAADVPEARRAQPPPRPDVPSDPHPRPDAPSGPNRDGSRQLVAQSRLRVAKSGRDLRGSSPQALVLHVGDPSPEPLLLAVIPLSSRPPGRRPSTHAARRRPVVAGVVLAVAATAAILLLGSSNGSDSHGRRYARHLLLHVENVATSGAKATVEDTSPLRLVTRPWVYCGRRHCLIFKTERERGQVYDGAFCQTLGERTTNGSDDSRVDDHNPQLRSTRRYYGVELADGTIGYVSAAWLSNRDRGGLGLPSCSSLDPVPPPGRAALLAAAGAT